MIWCDTIRRYRERHGLTQSQLACALDVSQRTISRWERGEDRPSLTMQRRLRDLGWSPSSNLVASLTSSVRYCPASRALSLMPRLKLMAVSQKAIVKRPSIVTWIGRDLAPLATGVLAQMLDDRELQGGIANGDISAVVATSTSVLRLADEAQIGTWQMTITYFRYDGDTYSDAQAMPVPQGTPLGYRAIPMDLALEA